MKKVIITNGSGRSGKDTFASFMKNYITVTKYSSIDFFKMIGELGGMSKSKGESERKLLNDLKTAFINYNNLPFYQTKEKIEEFLDKDNTTEVLLIDIREPEEIQKIKKEFPHVITVLVINNNIPLITSNIADLSVFDYVYDYIIDNSGSLKDLQDSVETFLEEIKN